MAAVAEAAVPLRRCTLQAVARLAEVRKAELCVPPFESPPAIANLIAHVGVGGFHRSHLAYFTDTLLRGAAEQNRAWGITGIGLMPWDAEVGACLKRQDMLYTLVMQDADHASARVVEAIQDYVFVPDEAAALDTLCVDERLKIISLTVTEKGYYQDVKTGTLDLAAPLIAIDLAGWNTADGGLVAPRTAFGFICTVLQRRKSAEMAACTVLSCDNLPLNGDLCKAATLAFARAADIGLAEWIEWCVTFPNSMVDRITPATDAGHKIALETEYGIVDEWPVVAERFAQWVIEDKFVENCRPSWDAFEPTNSDESVLFVEDVEPYEMMKLRLLNSSHSALAAVGLILGHRLVHSSLCDVDLRTFLRDFMAELEPTLCPVPGVDVKQYQRVLLERFANPRIKDQLSRLAQDASQKFATTLRLALTHLKSNSREVPPQTIALALAAFLKCAAEDVDEMGESFTVLDPSGAAELAPLAKRVFADYDDDHLDATRQALLLIFGFDIGEWTNLVEEVDTAAQNMKADGIRAVLRRNARQVQLAESTQRRTSSV